MFVKLATTCISVSASRRICLNKVCNTTNKKLNVFYLTDFKYLHMHLVKIQ